MKMQTVSLPAPCTTNMMQNPSQMIGSANEAAPVFIKSPHNITATKGQLVVFECRIQASPTLQVRWYRDYNQIIDSADFRILRKKACSSMVPEEVCSLVITEAFPEDSGIYICIAENDLGAVASSAFLWVYPGTEETGSFESAPLSSDMLTSMNINSAPDSQFVMGREAEDKSSDESGQNASGSANEMEHESSQWQNYSNQSNTFPGIYENPFDNSHYCSYSKPMYKPQTGSLKQVPKTSDKEIQGTKDALIQDLERKLRCKDNLLHNGNQRLSYEERMARRLLGPENAASMFVPQNEQNAQDAQQQNLESVRLQVPPPHVRNRPSSRGERSDEGAIQEKFFQPRFLQVPEDITVEEGRFCRIDFKVSGLPTPDVAWYLNGRLVHPDEFHKMIVSEKGFHSFIFEAVRVYDAGRWECVAYNRAGEASFAMKLDVIAKEHRKAPVFIFKAQSTKVYEGDSARIECQVSAIPPPQIYWKRNNEMVQFNTDRVSMFHDAAGKVCLLIHSVNKKDAGWYTVSAVNEAGVATCHARLDVATHTYKPLPNPKPLKVRPTFSKYLALNGKGVNVKQAFFPDEGEYQRMAAQSGLFESDEL